MSAPEISIGQGEAGPVTLNITNADDGYGIDLSTAECYLGFSESRSGGTSVLDVYDADFLDESNRAAGELKFQIPRSFTQGRSRGKLYGELTIILDPGVERNVLQASINLVIESALFPHAITEAPT